MADQDNTLQALLARVQALEARVQTAEDIEAINKLTRAYGYYLDKALWAEMSAYRPPWSSVPFR